MLRENYNGVSFDADPSDAVAGILSERDVAVGLPPLARAELERVTPILRLIGHLTPLILFAIATVFSDSLLAIAGVAAVAGGVIWKYTIIVSASYQQGFAMPKMPRRGSSTRAAPARKDGLNVRPDS